jgi:hypothetical protein
MPAIILFRVRSERAGQRYRNPENARMLQEQNAAAKEKAGRGPVENSQAEPGTIAALAHSCTMDTRSSAASRLQHRSATHRIP